jgi:hypothetical protein
MTATMLDQRPNRPECCGAGAMTAPLSATSRHNPPGRRRPVCEWKRTAYGQVTCTWTLSDAHPAWLPEFSSEEGLMCAPPAESCVQAFAGGTAIAGKTRFPMWMRQYPRPARTILGLAVAVGLLGLVAADLCLSTAAHPLETSQVSSINDHAVPAVARPAMMDIIPAPVIDPDAEFFLGTGDGGAGAWVRPATSRP